MKNQILKLLMFLVVILHFTFYILHFAFAIDTGFSADADRIGRNVIAETNKSYLMFYNPAGLYDIASSEIFIDYNMLYKTLTDETEFVNNTIGYCGKLFNGGVGIGINQFGIIDWYQKDTIVISYGRAIIEYFPDLKLGAKIKILREGYILDEYMRQNPVFTNLSEKMVLAMSLGGQYAQGNNIFGIFVENLNQPDIGFSVPEYLPLELNFGYKYIRDKLKLFVSAKYENNIKGDYTIGSAVEYDIIPVKWIKFSPSMGINYGNRNFTMLSFGFFAQVQQFEISYSYNIDPLQKIDVGGQQRVSVGYKFTPQIVSAEKFTKQDYDRLIAEKEVLQNKIKSLQTVLQKEKPSVKQKIVPTPTPTIPPVTTSTTTVSITTSAVTETDTTTSVEPVEPTTIEKMLLERLKDLEEKLKETEKKKIIPVTPVISPTPVTPVTPTTPKKRYHTVIAGDSLPKLAEKYYGDSSKWKPIYDANKNKIIRGQLVPGSVLEIP